MRQNVINVPGTTVHFGAPCRDHFFHFLVPGELGAVIAQEMLLREMVLDDETLQRVADFLGVTPED